MTKTQKNPQDLAVRGVIAGEDAIPLSQIREMLHDALAPTDALLAAIAAAARPGNGP